MTRPALAYAMAALALVWGGYCAWVSSGIHDLGRAAQALTGVAGTTLVGLIGVALAIDGIRSRRDSRLNGVVALTLNIAVVVGVALVLVRFM
jgi:hypothetical protein